MFETNLVVVGNVLTAPQWRRVSSTGSLVANFRVASTSRRYERETGRWVDGNSLRVRVTAWRKLAEGVASSIAVGDPVVVYGRLFTRDWKDENGTSRVSYEIEAFSIGHDLSKGRAKFFRSKSAGVNSEIAGADGDTIVGGESSVLVAAEDAPVGYGDGLPERFADEDEPTFDVLTSHGVQLDDSDEFGSGSESDELSADDASLDARPAGEATQAGGARRARRGSAKREPASV